MKTAALIFFSILLFFSPMRFASAQNHLTPEGLHTSLRSGNPQRVLEAVQQFEHDSLTRLLYRNLCLLSESNPDTQIQRSRVAKALGFTALTGIDENGTPLTAKIQQERRQRLLGLLRTLNPEVGNITDDFQWKAVELMQFSAAYDYYRSVAGPDAEVEALLASFTRNAASQLDGFLVPRNNLSIKLASAVGYSALILESSADQATAQSCPGWLAKANDFIASTIWYYQSSENGAAGYSEGPYYFRYALQNLLPYLIALDNRASGNPSVNVGDENIANLVREDRFRRLVEWIIVLRQPDGRLPAFEDTYVDSYFPELGLLAQLSSDNLRYAWTNFAQERSPETPDRLDAELSRNFDSREEYILARPSMNGAVVAPQAGEVLDAAGYAVFRSSWEHDALYLALIGKHGVARTHRSPIGSGHKQANEGAFIIHAGGTLLGMEPGYHSYDGRDSIMFSENHNVILVDGRGPDDVSFGTFLFGADAYMENPILSETLDRVTIRTNYNNADVERNAYFFDRRFIIMYDRLSSSQRRTWTHQVHGNASLDDGSFSADPSGHTATWVADGMRLTSFVDAAGAEDVQQAVSRKHSPGYHKYAQHAALYTTVTGDDAAFHSFFLADKASSIPHVIRLNTEGRSSAVRLDIADGAVVSILQAGATGRQIDAGSLGRISSDALLLVHARYGDGTTEATFAERITELIVDDRGVFRTDQPATVAWKNSDHAMNLTIVRETPGLCYLRLPYQPLQVTGDGMRGWSMTGNMLTVETADPQCDLSITFSSTPASASVAASPEGIAISAVWPNPVSTAVNDRLHAAITLDGARSVELSLWNTLGRRVRTTKAEFLQSGRHMLSVPTHDLPRGIYFLRLEHIGGMLTRPFLIQ